MYTFEDVFKKMTREEIKEFEDAMGMSVNDFLMEADDNPFVATVAAILLSATVGNEIAKRG
jgi:Mg2+ and Co2+ transporter CorA